MVDTQSPVPDAEHDLILSVHDLKHYIDDVNAAKAERSHTAQDRARAEHEALLKRLKSDAPLSEELIKNFFTRLKDVALQGVDEIMIGRFPNEICTDHGRAINQSEENWPDTLQGRPRKVYEFWKENLQERGYSLKAMIVDWPNGMPGNVGMFLTWKI